MDFKKPPFLRDIVLILFILVAGVFVFWPSFSMALYGDEWQMLWYGKAISSGHLSPQLAETWNAYWNEMVVFNLLADTFGYHGIYFYLFSFICRFLAVIVLYIFLIRRSLGRLAAFSGSLLFMVTPIGVEATDWARNFDSYIGIVFLLLGVDMILKLKSTKHLLLIILYFIAGTLVNPLRSHGLLTVFSLMLVIQFFMSVWMKKGESRLYSLLGIISLPALYVFFIAIGVFGKLAGNLVGESFNFGEGITSLLAHGGNVFVPLFSDQYPDFRIMLFVILATAGLICLSFANFLKYKKILFWMVGLGLTFFCAVIIYLYPLTVKSSVIIELFFMVLLSLKIYDSLKEKKGNNIGLIFLCLVLSVGYMLYPALRQSWFHSTSDHRYLIYPALVIPILFALFIDKINSYGHVYRSFMFGLLVMILVPYISISFSYLRLHSLTHNSTYCSSVRNQVFSEVDNVDFKSSRKFFIFDTPNADESAKVYDCLTFGFMYIAGIRFNIWDEDLLPVAVYESQDGLKSMITDGETSRKYLGFKKIIPGSDIYAFKVDSGNVKRIMLEELF